VTVLEKKVAQNEKKWHNLYVFEIVPGEFSGRFEISCDNVSVLKKKIKKTGT